jgi:hypothetical protein
MWSAWENPGLEHLRFESGEAGGWADGVVIGGEDQPRFRLRYQLTWDAGWRTRTVQISRLDTLAWDLELTSDGHGRWFAVDGSPLPALDGCIDVDIQATPLTNTLPIRRLELSPGETADVRVTYVSVPDLAVSSEIQRYAALSADPSDLRYRFEASDGEFVAELTVDADGLVMTYPGLFRRV